MKSTTIAPLPEPLVSLTKLAAYLATLTAGVCQAQPTYSVAIPKPFHGVPARNASMASPVGQSSSTNNFILYHGGPVMNKPSGTNVYYIWYGNWSGDTSKQILTDFVQHLGGSPYFNINTTYYDYGPQGQQDQVFNKLNFGGGVDDNYSLGTSLSNFDVFQLTANHIGVDLPIDENGVYFVLTSADVNQQEFCSTFCAFHTDIGVIITGVPGVKDIKMAWVGNPNQCPAACAVQDPSPNNNPAADSMASFVAHELEESVTDPDLNAWYDAYGNENADLCVWTFGCTFTRFGANFGTGPACPQSSNGTYYNMKLGTHLYMIQQNWVNAKGGYSALSWDQ